MSLSMVDDQTRFGSTETPFQTLILKEKLSGNRKIGPRHHWSRIFTFYAEGNTHGPLPLLTGNQLTSITKDRLLHCQCLLELVTVVIFKYSNHHRIRNRTSFICHFHNGPFSSANYITTGHI